MGEPSGPPSFPDDRGGRRGHTRPLVTPAAPGGIERFHDRLIALHIAHIWTFALTYKTLNYM